MGSVSGWRRKAFEELTSLHQPQVGEAAEMSATVSPLIRDGQQTEKLGFAARVRVNMLFQQAVNGKGSISSFFCALFGPKALDDKKIQNLSLAANAIIKKRAEFARPQELTRTNTSKTQTGMEVVKTESEQITAKDFFNRTNCNQRTFLKLLQTTFNAVQRANGKLDFNCVKFTTPTSGYVEVDSGPLQERVTNCNTETPRTNDDVEILGNSDPSAFEADEHVSQNRAEQDGNDVHRSAQKIESGDDEFEHGKFNAKIPQEPKSQPSAFDPDEESETGSGETVSQTLSDELSPGSAADWPTDEFQQASEIPQFSAESDSQIGQVVPAKAMVVRKPLTNKGHRRPAALLDNLLAQTPPDKPQPGSQEQPTVAEPTQELPAAEPTREPPVERPTATQSNELESDPLTTTDDKKANDPTVTAEAGDGGASEIDDAKPVATTQLAPLDFGGDTMTGRVLHKLAEERSCIAKGYGIMRGACRNIDEFVEVAKGKTYNVNTSSKGYDQSLAAIFFKNNKSYFDIAATCDSGFGRSDYYYTISIKSGFKVVEQDGKFYVQKILDVTIDT
ncbi:MAG: hypothetical protein LBF26_01390 [Puniceicoccales bacterium]|jgi:hypothetical protein|nr:hypothetical protein [Puniceicoccales bacterium]